MIAYVGSDEHADRGRSPLPAYGPIDVVLGYVVFYVFVGRATPTGASHEDDDRHDDPERSDTDPERSRRVSRTGREDREDEERSSCPMRTIRNCYRFTRRT